MCRAEATAGLLVPCTLHVACFALLLCYLLHADAMFPLSALKALVRPVATHVCRREAPGLACCVAGSTAVRPAAPSIPRCRAPPPAGKGCCKAAEAAAAEARRRHQRRWLAPAPKATDSWKAGGETAEQEAGRGAPAKGRCHAAQGQSCQQHCAAAAADSKQQPGGGRGPAPGCLPAGSAGSRSCSLCRSFQHAADLYYHRGRAQSTSWSSASQSTTRPSRPFFLRALHRQPRQQLPQLQRQRNRACARIAGPRAPECCPAGRQRCCRPGRARTGRARAPRPGRPARAGWQAGAGAARAGCPSAAQVGWQGRRLGGSQAGTASHVSLRCQPSWALKVRCLPACLPAYVPAIVLCRLSARPFVSCSCAGRRRRQPRPQSARRSASSASGSGSSSAARRSSGRQQRRSASGTRLLRLRRPMLQPGHELSSGWQRSRQQRKQRLPKLLL